MSDRPLLEVQELVAGFTGPVAGPVSFSVMPGEIVGLNGANGVGKSTILAALTGVARVYSGSLQRMKGLRIAHHRQRAIRPGELPIRGIELARLAGADVEQCPEWLRGHLDRPMDELSGGQYQFLQTWCCLAGSADLVLLDEPSNNLDQDGIEVLGTLLHSLAPHRGVILVSHEADFLAANCTRIVEMVA